MALFFVKKKQKQTVKPSFACSVPYSNHFKGYKRIKLDAYQDPAADAGIQAFKNAEDAKEVTFEEYLFPDTSPLLRVFVDGNKLGTIWSTSYPEHYKKIRSGKCVKASAGYNDLGNIFLFVKFNE